MNNDIKNLGTIHAKECLLSAKHIIAVDPEYMKLYDEMLENNKLLMEERRGIPMVIEGKTNRGFKYFKFTDKGNNECSVQMSSFAGTLCPSSPDDNDPRIILGKHIPKIMAYGEGENIGKCLELEYPEIKGYSTTIDSRMDLSQSQVKELLPILTRFAETGEL